MKRRTFLGLSVGVLGAAAAGGLAFWPRSEPYEFYSAYGKWVSAWINKVAPPLKCHLVFFSPQTFATKTYDVPFRVHTGVQNPADKKQIVLIPKWGEQICSFHRPSGEVGKTLTLKPGRRFFGHAVWDTASGGFWVGENDDEKAQGFLVLRGADLEVIREIPSGGVYPHHIDLVEPGTLMVANSGNFIDQPGNLLWLRTQDGGVTRRLDFKNFLGLAGPSHFLKTKSGELFVGGVTATDEIPSCVWRVGSDGQIHQIKVAEDQRSHFRGEVTGLAECQEPAVVVWVQAKTEAVFGIPANANALALKQMGIPSRGIISDGSGVILTKGTAILKWNGGRAIKVGTGPASFPNERWGAHIMRAET